jgi:hypothetical protein
MPAARRQTVLTCSPATPLRRRRCSKIAPALMAGNSVVLKPPTQGSVAGLLMVQCFAAAGVPPGVLNCVTGRGSEIGDYLTTHPLVSAISFTGGDTGIDICRKAGMVPIQVGGLGEQRVLGAGLDSLCVCVCRLCVNMGGRRASRKGGW